MSEPERQRGPIEQRLHDLIRQRASSTPWLLDAQIEGRRDFTPIEHIKQLQVVTLLLVEALLELAREMDDLQSP